MQPAAAGHRAERRDPVLHDRLGRLHHPGEEAPPARRGLAAQLPGGGARRARRACGSRSRCSEDVDPYSMDDVMWCLTTRVNPKTDILNPIPGGRGQTFMPAERMTAGDKQWTASNTQFEGGMGIDATVPYRLRERLPAAGLSDRPGEAGGLLHQEGHRERQVAHGRLGQLAGANGPVVRAGPIRGIPKENVFRIVAARSVTLSPCGRGCGAPRREAGEGAFCFEATPHPARRRRSAMTVRHPLPQGERVTERAARSLLPQNCLPTARRARAGRACRARSWAATRR